jgi:hypothetical protein
MINAFTGTGQENVITEESAFRSTIVLNTGSIRHQYHLYTPGISYGLMGYRISDGGSAILCDQ